MRKTNILPKRNEVAIEYTWDATAVFPNDAAWEAAITNLTAELPHLAQFAGRLGEGAATLVDFLEKRTAVIVQARKIGMYASLFHEVDTADAAASAKRSRAMGLFAQTAAAIAFAEPEMLALGLDTIRGWVDAEPGLAIYDHYFDTLAQRKAHVRSAEVEQILSLLADPFRTATATHGILADADLTFEPATAADSAADPQTVAQGTINALLTDPDRELRRTGWANYCAGYLDHKRSMANLIATGVKQNVFRARVRRYESTLHAALAPNNIPVAVYHNTIETFQRHLPTWHRYWRVRRKALGYDKLHMYDVKAPLTAVKPKVPFAQAMEWIAAGLAPLGADYVRPMQQGVAEQRWVDIYPNQGKRSGAFSAGVKGTYPYILMNYVDDLFSLSTLAHELGHSMHSYLTWQNQPFIYSWYSIFAAEVASNFNQALVRAYLLDNNDDPNFQIAVIEEAMSNFHRYFFIMPTLARFELAIHEQVEKGGAITADYLCDLTADLFAEGFGGEVAVDRDQSGIIWAQFPNHLYSNFYVYQYTTGIAAAHALADKVLTGEPGAVDNYLAFLKAGSSMYPLDALQMAGVDMASPEPVERTFGVLADMVDRLEELVNM